MDRADIETSVCDSSREKEDQTKDIAVLNHPIKHDKNMAETSPTLRRRKNTHHNSSESDPFTVPQENHVVQDHDSGNSHARTVNEVKKVAESEQQSQKDCHNEHVALAHSESSTNYAYQIYRNDISCIGGGHSGDDHLLKPPSADVHLLEPPTISASLHNDTLCDNNGEANTSHIHTNGINHMDPQQSFRPGKTVIGYHTLSRLVELVEYSYCVTTDLHHVKFANIQANGRMTPFDTNCGVYWKGSKHLIFFS